jgi:hypothetical protein
MTDPCGEFVEIEPRLKLVPFDNITVGSTAVYLVKGIIPRTGLTVVWGPPKCGKSFWTFDLVMHVALSRPYRGRRVWGGPVVYLALEGAEGFKARIEAFRMRHLAEQAEAVPFFLMAARIDLIKDHAELIGAIRAQAGVPAVVAIDTLNRSLVGSESDDKDMAAYMRAENAIREAFGCAVVIVHHCGVDASRPRGHTSLTGAADAQIAVKRAAANNIVATVEWMKDGPEGDQFVSRLESVEVGIDEDGAPITSCVVVPIEDGVIEKPAAKPPCMPKPAQIALRALKAAIDERGEDAPVLNHIPAGVRVTTFKLWRQYSYQRDISTGEERAKQKAFKQGSEYLICTGEVGEWIDHVWLNRRDEPVANSTNPS